MSSILVRKNGGDWTPLQPGRACPPYEGAGAIASRGHRTLWSNQQIDPKLIGVSCLVTGVISLREFQPTGHFAATVRADQGWQQLIETFGSSREWDGGIDHPFGRQRTGHFQFQFMATPASSTVSVSFRFDMSGTGTAALNRFGYAQSSMFIIPVWS